MLLPINSLSPKYPYDLVNWATYSLPAAVAPEAGVVGTRGLMSPAPALSSQGTLPARSGQPNASKGQGVAASGLVALCLWREGN